MAINQPRTWVIAYDIALSKRLQRVHRYLKDCAIPLQYSVFCARASASQIGCIRQDLEGLINPREDDVRIYLVPETVNLVIIGRRTLPDELQLVGAANPFLEKATSENTKPLARR